MENADNEKQGPRDSGADDDQSQVHSSRRRFGKAGLAAPVLMTLASRPVWASSNLRQCTVSALASFEVNKSRPIDLDTCTACSPGYWHNQVCWPDGWDPTTLFYQQFNQFPWSGYDLLYYTGKSSIPGPATPVQGDRPSYDEIAAVLQTPLGDFFPSAGGTGDLFKLCRAVVAAMLNAVHPHVPFALYTSDILATLTSVFPLTADIVDEHAPTAENSALLSKVSDIALWDENSDVCILPGSGNCP